MASISVIIPVYNHAHTLERCLASIRAQTVQPLELIIVNDGSTDNFNEIIKKIDKSGLNTKIVRQSNQGAAAARNRGFRESTGEYVIFLDADTVAKPKMLEKMAAMLAAHPEASYAYSQFKFGWKTMQSQEFSQQDLKQYNFIDTTALVRRSALQKTPPSVPPLIGEGEVSDDEGFPFDESLKRFQDWDLWLTLLAQGHIGVFSPKVLYKKIVSGRKGISTWLPSFVYRFPWKIKAVKAYEESKYIILRKHHLDAR